MLDIIQRYIPPHVDTTLLTKGVFRKQNLQHQGENRYIAGISETNVLTTKLAALVSQPAKIGENTLDVWKGHAIPSGSYVKIKSANYEVNYYEEEDGVGTIYLKTPLLENCDCDTQILMLSVPFTVNGRYPNPVTSFVLISPIPVFETDRISINNRIHAITRVDIDHDNINQYSIFIDRPTNGDISFKTGRLVTTPAFYSEEVFLIDNQINGPFILDFYNGTQLQKDIRIKGFVEFFNHKTSVTKISFEDLNDPIVANFLTIENLNFLVSNKLEGTFDYMHNRFVLIANPGTGRASTELVFTPHLSNEFLVQWTMSVIANEPMELYVHLKPNETQTFKLVEGYNHITIKGPSQMASPIERLRMGILGSPKAEARFSHLVSPHAVTHYRYMLNVYSNEDPIYNEEFMVTHPLLKPLLLDTKTTFARLDGFTKLNSGYMTTPMSRNRQNNGNVRYITSSPDGKRC